MHIRVNSRFEVKYAVMGEEEEEKLKTPSSKFATNKNRKTNLV